MARIITRGFRRDPNSPRLGDLLDFEEVAAAVHGNSAYYGNPAELLDHEDDMNDTNETTTPTASVAEDREPYRGIGALNRDLEQVDDIPTHDVGADVFDAIEGLNRRGQIVALRTLANSALANAIYSAQTYLSMTGNGIDDNELLTRVEQRRQRYLHLSAWATDEVRLLSDNQFDQPMTLVQMFDLLTKNEPRTFDRDEAIFLAAVKAMGFDDTDLPIIKAEREQALRRAAVKQQQAMLDNRDEIFGDLHGADPKSFNANHFDVRDHAKLFDKVYDGLRKAARRALTMIGRYDDAQSDALDLNASASVIDTALVKFRRRNRDELTDPLNPMA